MNLLQLDKAPLCAVKVKQNARL